MGYVYAFRSAFHEQIKQDMQLGEVLFFLVVNIPLAVVLAWIASKGESSAPIDYLLVGVLLMSIWNRVSIRLGWTITGDILVGTYDYIATARTPLALIVFTRALAISVLGILSGLLPILVMVWISGRFIQISDPLLLCFGIGVGAFSVLAVSIIFAPLFLLVRGREGFFNVIRPMGVVLGGFFYPVAFLAPGVEVVARILPAAWAMDAVIIALESEGNPMQGAIALVIALAISLAYLALAYLLLIKVEHRICSRTGQRGQDHPAYHPLHGRGRHLELECALLGVGVYWGR